MLHAVARWRAPDAHNSNKSLLMLAADPHVNCRCACPGVCLSTTALPVREGFAEMASLQGTPTIKISRQVHHCLIWECDNGHVPPGEFGQQIWFAPDPTLAGTTNAVGIPCTVR